MRRSFVLLAAWTAACVPSGTVGEALLEDGSTRPALDGGFEPADGASPLPDAALTPEDAGPADGGSAADAAAGMDAAVPDTSFADAGTPVACPPAPAGVSANAAAAHDHANAVRSAMGVPCATMDLAINTAAELHCQYYQANRGNGNCTSNPHVEVMGCDQFVAAQFDGRMRAAGYGGAPAFENMHFIANGPGAVQGWIDSVWHRTPVLSPWIAEWGYGSAPGCDTGDYASGRGAPQNTIATYPYDGQVDVPVSFDGRFEGPNPPAPPDGWPSGYPIHFYFIGQVDAHVLTVDGDATPIEHVWLSPGTQPLLRTEFVLYANTPLSPNTRYRVSITGSNRSGPITHEWTFTTR